MWLMTATAEKQIVAMLGCVQIEEILNRLSNSNSGIAGIWVIFLPCCGTCTCVYYNAARICVILPS